MGTYFLSVLFKAFDLARSWLSSRASAFTFGLVAMITPWLKELTYIVYSTFVLYTVYTVRTRTKLKMMLTIYWRRLLKLLKSVEDADR